MKKRDIGGVIVGVGILILAIPLVTGYLGIDIPDPFKPIANVKVTISPDCIGTTPAWCYIGADRTSIDVTTTQTLSIFQTYVCYPAWQWYGHVSPKLVIRDSIGNVVYNKPRKPVTTICHAPLSFDFRFNYEKGECYDMYLDVYGDVDNIIYSVIKTGVCL